MAYYDVFIWKEVPVGGKEGGNLFTDSSVHNKSLPPRRNTLMDKPSEQARQARILISVCNKKEFLRASLGRKAKKIKKRK